MLISYKTRISAEGYLVAKRKHKFSCTVCEKNCSVNQQSVCCTQCLSWGHGKCNGTSKADFDILSEEDDDMPFHCILCAIHNDAENISYGYSSASELLDLYGVDLPSQQPLLPYYNVWSKLNKMPNMTDFDMNETLAHTINSRYMEAQLVRLPFMSTVHQIINLERIYLFVKMNLKWLV